MAPDNSICAVPYRPQVVRFIVALFLVKSKSANISARDYLTQLRPWIKRGGRPDTSADIHSHLDTLGFWKDAHKKSQETVTELQARVSELERRREKQDQQMSLVSMNTGLQRKRKSSLAGQGESPSGRASKQARTTTSATVPQDENTSLALSLDDGENSPPDTYSATLLHNIYILQQLRSYQRPPAQELATILFKITTDIDRMVSTIAPPAVIATPNVDTRNGTTRALERTMAMTQIATDFTLDSRLSATGRIFPWVLESIDLLDHTPAGKGLQSQVVYSYITLFRNCLNRICDLAISQCKNPASRRTQKGKNNRAQMTVQTPPPSTLNDKTTSKLCHLLVSMAARLEPSKQTHQDILDGFLSFLLSRVGQLLSLFVFSNSFIEDTTETSPEERNSIEESKSQAPYLIYILSRLNPVTARPSPSLLAEKAMAKLQHTLLKAVFADQTEEFVEALREPRDPGIGLNVNEMVDVLGATGRVSGDVGDWYKSEVWRIVGWEALMKHIEWPDEENYR